MKHRIFSLSGLLSLLVLFVAFSVANSLLWSGARLDLTENRQYSLSDGTRHLLAQIKEPIKLEFFFSEENSKNIPTIRAYASRIRDLLKEYQLAAKGKLDVQWVDPAPFSEQEDRASELGLQAVPIGQNGTSTLYMGLAASNSVDEHQVIAFFQPDKEAQLEYELSKLIHRLSQVHKPVVGLVAGLPVAGGMDMSMGMQAGMKPAWMFYEQLQQLYEIRQLGADFKQLDSDIDLVLMIQPSGLTEASVYALDQYVLKGGKLMLFADPYPEAGGPMAGALSDLSKLYQSWGIELDTSHLVLDNQNALQLQTARDKPPVRHLGLLGLTEDSINLKEVYAAQLERINLGSIGAIRRKSEAASSIEFTPLLQSSEQSMLLAKDKYLQLSQPELLQNDFISSNQRQVLAARIQGKFHSAFSANPDNTSKEPRLTESQKPAQILVVADTDLLSDRMWVRVQDFMNQRIAMPFASNGELIANAVDSFSGAADLIGLRGRERLERPFKRVLALRQTADAQFAQSQKNLESKLQETERKLVDLQTQQKKDSAMVLSPEQEQALQGFQDERIKIRKELREVRHQLDKDIEALGASLKWLNIGLVPLCLVLLGAVVAIRRRRLG